MNSKPLLGFFVVFACLLEASTYAQVRTLRECTNTSVAVIRVDAGHPTGQRVPPMITGKFAEHLGANIYKGMDAQVLANPTFAAYPIWTGAMTPDGITKFISDSEAFNQKLRRQARDLGWPDGDVDEMVRAQGNALACFWMRVGAENEVRPSPDTGPFGGRAQRVEVSAAGQGIAQWSYLPLHRTHNYEFEIFLRSPEIASFTLSVSGGGLQSTPAVAHINGASSEWRKFSGKIELPESFAADAPVKVLLTADSPGQFVIQRLLLRPSDHVNGADPDIVRYLKDSKLPLLRWPGGNFVSSYHWQDGVGPFEKRPTLPNFAWGGLEPNLFGTDEFIAFCRAVGCEPMICVNGGTGTPEEAVQWIEYCNGSIDSPMGKLRAANGHPEPYNVKYWEVGNELWGNWQANWTTPAGYADRYLRFAEKMRAADPTIKLYACGAPVLWGRDWNNTLISRAGAKMQATTDHPLVGGSVNLDADPLDVYRDFMGVPEILEKKWTDLEQSMHKACISNPHLAITELQLFAHLGERPASGTVRLTGENLVNPGTQAEAVYDVLMYHVMVRMSPFVEFMTHSAIVNHGGGLRKQRERVYANPCYYVQSAFAAFAGKSIVPVEIESSSEKTPLVLPDIRSNGATSFSAVDAIAAVGEDGLWISLVHRGTSGPVDLTVDVNGFEPSGVAHVRMQTAQTPWTANSLKEPELVKPVDSQIAVEKGKVRLTLPPYTVVRVQIPAVK